MKHILRYLKPFLVGVLAAVALLFAQAMCDLSLPTYMSDIVNVGILQGGIEHAAPEALSAQGMQLMRSFMTEEEQAVVDAHYTLTDVAQKHANGKTYGEIYANLSEEQLYVRNADVDQEIQAKLDGVMGHSTVVMTNLLKALSPRAQDAKPAEQQSMDVKTMYQMLNMALPLVTQEQWAQARHEADAIPAMLHGQAGIRVTRSILEEMGADLEGIQQAYVLRVGLLMLLITAAGGVATVLVGLLLARTSAGVARNLRKKVFAKVESFSNTELDRFSTASLITRTTNDVTNVSMFVMMGLRMLCYAPILCVGGIIMAMRRAPSMTWVIALASAVLLVLVTTVMLISLPRFKRMQGLIDKLNLVARESLAGLPVIRAFGTAKHEQDRFDNANKDLTKVSLFVNRVMAFMMPVVMFLMNVTSLLIMWVGAHEIADSTLMVGDMMAFMQYAMQIIMSFMFMTMIVMFMPRALVSAGRLAEVLDTEPCIKDPAQPKSFDPDKRGLVVFDHVSFRYEGAEEDALHDITFTALPGQTMAIIGSTGSGKSTIANMLMRFYDATHGAVLVDGVDVRAVAQDDLRGRIGFVPQKGVLHTGTIATNLRYGDDDASVETLEESARIAQALPFIQEKEAGFDTEIAQGGTNVSGGQKQRLAIARALVKKPEILVFDDSFSALDFKTDAALRRALKESAAQTTQIIVAQRVNTILHADQIVVLEKGSVVGKGTHNELLNTCAEYREIATSQLSKEELA